MITFGRSDLLFFNSLEKCFAQDQNCKQCPMYGQGFQQKGQCKDILSKEIRQRKIEEIRKEESEG